MFLYNPPQLLFYNIFLVIKVHIITFDDVSHFFLQKDVARRPGKPQALDPQRPVTTGLAGPHRERNAKGRGTQRGLLHSLISCRRRGWGPPPSRHGAVPDGRTAGRLARRRTRSRRCSAPVFSSIWRIWVRTVGRLTPRALAISSALWPATSPSATPASAPVRA